VGVAVGTGIALGRGVTVGVACGVGVGRGFLRAETGASTAQEAVVDTSSIIATLKRGGISFSTGTWD
jgi:hypothetical protein